MKKIYLIMMAAIMSLMGSLAFADYKPAVIYDMGGKFDKSFNEGVYNGVQKFVAETGIEVMEFEVTNATQRQQAMEKMIQRGATLVLGVGFAQADAIDKVAEANPDVMFAIIDVYWLNRPNIRQYTFKEHEGSYLVGIAAAMATKSGTVGFVGGLDGPLINAFQCGYEQGIHATNPEVKLLKNMTGVTPAAWNDPAKGAELAQGQIDRGADIVYQAAGGTGAGVIQATVDAGKLAIGVDINQNGLAPGQILTSMLKGMDAAAYDTLKDGMSGTFNTELKNLGLAEGGVGWALDEHNADLITDEMKTAIDSASAKIISGELKVHDYRSDNACPI
ncbi:BMP family ABC transporter substrate-binding protein [Amylibacter sp.]|nr:BMP family ABC transporter substrate-binding protein [Amylibacter sp.]MDC1264241.1 BMP family ABC transporter substrate-binding protein [Amylibacter sp.]